MSSRRSRHRGRRPPAVRAPSKGLTMLMRFEPFREFDRAAEDLLSETASTSAGRRLPRGNEFKVDLDLPGADPGSIDLTVESDVLTVRATRSSHETKATRCKCRAGPRPVRPPTVPGESLDRTISRQLHDGCSPSPSRGRTSQTHKVEITTWAVRRPPSRRPWSPPEHPPAAPTKRALPAASSQVGRGHGGYQPAAPSVHVLAGRVVIGCSNGGT